MNTGYFPGVASIGDKIVYIENRDGNANVKTGQAETLERAYLLLNEHGMTINRSRMVTERSRSMDAGSYSEDILQVVASIAGCFTFAPINAEVCVTVFVSYPKRNGKILKSIIKSIRLPHCLLRNF
jgi:hypothetical protein